MKTILLSTILFFGLCVATSFVMVGCTTSSQTTAYKTIASVEATAQTAYDGYATLVINGTVATNGLSKVSAAYNQLQADALLAATLSSEGTNAIATTNLLNDATLLTSVISTASTLK